MKKIYYASSYINSTYLYLYNIKLNKFMKQKPPCKDCLKEVMCINIVDVRLSPGSKWGTIQIRTCEDLKKFIIKNKKFERTK